MFITCAAVLLHQIRHLVKLISINIAISVQVEHFKCNFEMPNKSVDTIPLIYENIFTSLRWTTQ